MAASEANRLIRVVHRSCTPIYSLVLDMLGRLGSVITRTVVIDGGDGVAGSVVLCRGEEEITLPCHPADALALALRTRAPILATDEALAHACPAHPASPAGLAEAAPWVRDIRPEDFETPSGWPDD